MFCRQGKHIRLVSRLGPPAFREWGDGMRGNRWFAMLTEIRFTFFCLLCLGYILQTRVQHGTQSTPRYSDVFWCILCIFEYLMYFCIFCFCFSLSVSFFCFFASDLWWPLASPSQWWSQLLRRSSFVCKLSISFPFSSIFHFVSDLLRHSETEGWWRYVGTILWLCSFFFVACHCVLWDLSGRAAQKPHLTTKHPICYLTISPSAFSVLGHVLLCFGPVFTCVGPDLTPNLRPRLNTGPLGPFRLPYKALGTSHSNIQHSVTSCPA